VELTSSIPKRYYSLRFIQKEDDAMETAQCVSSFVNHQALTQALVNPSHVPNFLVVGMVGRKGPKDDPGVLGKVAYESLHRAHIPCILVKKELEDKPALTYVFCATGSQICKNGLQLIFPLLKPRDTLYVLHVVSELEVGVDVNNDGSSLPPHLQPDVVTSYYTGVYLKNHNPIHHSYNSHFFLHYYFLGRLEEQGPVGSEFVIKNHKGGHPVHETIQEFVTEVEADFLCLAPRCKTAMSSTTSHLIAKTRTNIILCKN